MIFAALPTRTIPPLTIGFLCVLGAAFLIALVLDLRRRFRNARRPESRKSSARPPESRWQAWLRLLSMFVLAATVTCLRGRNLP